MDISGIECSDQLWLVETYYQDVELRTIFWFITCEGFFSTFKPPYYNFTDSSQVRTTRNVTYECWGLHLVSALQFGLFLWGRLLRGLSLPLFVLGLCLGFVRLGSRFNVLLGL